MLTKVPTNRLRKTIQWFILLCAILLAYLVIALLLDPYQNKTKKETVSTITSVSYEPFELRPFEYYEKALTKKLVFQPPRYEESMIEARKDGVGSLELLGITGTEGNWRALIKNKETETCSLYTVGQMIGDLQIESIKNDGVILKHGENRVELKR